MLSEITTWVRESVDGTTLVLVNAPTPDAVTTGEWTSAIVGVLADMTPLKVCTTALVLFGSIAVADNAQTDLARQIEETSQTSKSFGTAHAGWTYQHFITVGDCIIAAETVVSAPGRPNSTWGIDIDLTRTRLPEPTASEQGFMLVGQEDSMGAIIFLDFVPPYRPSTRGNQIGGNLPHGPTSSYRFILEGISDNEQPHRLLTLLYQYQAKYCTPSG